MLNRLLIKLPVYLCLMLTIFSTTVSVAVPDVIDYSPQHLEDKLKSDLDNLLSRLVGEDRFIASVQIHAAKIGRENISKTFKPMDPPKELYTANKDSDLGFPQLLSPSLITAVNQKHVDDSKANPNLLQGYNEDVQIYNSSKYKIQRVNYTVVIDEKEQAMPGYDETNLRALVNATINLKRARGDTLIIQYSSFSNKLFTKTDMSYQFNLLFKKISFPPWLLYGLSILFLLIVIISLFFVLYKTIVNIIDIHSKHKEKLVNLKMQMAHKHMNDDDDVQEIIALMSSHPEHFATLIKDWVEEAS